VKLILSIYLVLLVGCASSTTENSAVDRPLVESDYLLKQDREEFDQLRSDVPEDIKLENDEKAYMDRLFTDPLKKPSVIKERFNRFLSQKRDKFQKDQKLKRENFVKNERKQREEFVRELAKERENFKQQKVDKQKTKEFFDELDLKRKDFFSEQKEKRELFEAQIRDDRNNFSDYSKEKQSEFNNRLKIFTDQQKSINKQ